MYQRALYCVLCVFLCNKQTVSKIVYLHIKKNYFKYFVFILPRKIKEKKLVNDWGGMEKKKNEKNSWKSTKKIQTTKKNIYVYCVYKIRQQKQHQQQ